MNEKPLEIIWNLGTYSMEYYLRNTFSTYDDTFFWTQEGHSLILVISDSKYCKFVFRIKESRVILTEKFFVLLHALCGIPSNEVMNGAFVKDKYLPDHITVEMVKTEFVISNRLTK